MKSLTDADDRRIREAWQRFAAAWAAADSRSSVAVWEEDGDHRMLGCAAARCGREALEQALAEAFARRPRNYSRRMTISLSHLRLVADDVAVVDGEIRMTAGIGASGAYVPAIAEPFASVMLRRGDEWRIAASRVAHPLTLDRSPEAGAAAALAETKVGSRGE